MSKVRDLKNNFALHFAALFGAAFLFVGKPVPYSNEYNYLLRLRQLYDSSYLPNDITFSTPTSEYWLFDHVFGLFTFFLSIEILGWLGRIAFWSLLLIVLIRLGRRWEISQWMISISIFLWLAIGQSVIGDEWMLGGFEAKSVAYVLLIVALDRFCDGRDLSSAILLGFAFAVHPIVGFWGILALLPTLMIAHADFRRVFKVACISGLLSLIGAIPLLLMLSKSVQPTLEGLKFFQLVRFSLHLDPFAWSRSAIILVCLMLAFCVFVHFSEKRTKPLNLIISFISILGAYFILGLFARAFEVYEVMKYMPTRLFVVFIPLFFFFYLFKSFSEGLYKKPVLLGLLGMIVFGSIWIKLPMRPIAQARATAKAWGRNQDNFANAFIWLRSNSKNDALVIAPPWRYDFWYRAERAEVVNYHKPIVADIDEWIKRLEKLTGKADAAKGSRDLEDVIKVYNSLSKSEVDKIADEYQANYFISETKYPYQIVFTSGNVKIYSVSPK